MCHILLEDSENAVRCGAALAISTIINKHSVKSQTLAMLYKVMWCAMTEDDSTIRRNVLRFWNNVVDVHLADQGMTDSDFPEATFSKELKKIIILNEKEIRKRLVKVMYQLSDIGCLAVLLDATGDSDVRVVALVEKILGKLMTLLEKYKVSISHLNEAQQMWSTSSGEKDLSENRSHNGIKRKAVCSPMKFLESINDFLYPCDNALVDQSEQINTILKELVDSPTKS